VVAALASLGDATVAPADPTDAPTVGSPIELTPTDLDPEVDTRISVTWHLDSASGPVIGEGLAFSPTAAHAGRRVVAVIRLAAEGHREKVITHSFDVPRLTVARPTVTVSGKAHVGARLTARFTSTPQVAASIEWKRGSVVVGRGASYVVKAKDAGARLQAVATVTQLGHTPQRALRSTAVVTAPVSVKVSAKKPKRSARQVVTIGKVDKGQTVTVRVNKRIVAVAKVRGNGKLASVRAPRVNGTKVVVKASGKRGLKVTFRVPAKKGSATVVVSVAGRPDARTTYRVR